MSWLSSIGSDIGNFFTKDVEPALKNPLVDVGLAAGGALLGGAFLAPELLGAGGLFGTAADTAATTGGIDAVTTGAAVDAASAGGSSLGAAATAADPYAGLIDAVPGSGTPTWLDTATGADIAPTSGLPATGGAAPTGGIPTVSPTDTPLASNWYSTPTPANPLNESGTFGFQSAAPSTDTGGFLSNLGTSLTKNPLSAVGAAAGLGGLGYNLYQGYQEKQQLAQLQQNVQQQAQQQQQQEAALQAQAAPELAVAQQYMQYAQTGQLPPNVQAQVTQQVQAAKARIIQGYASKGMSTDPNQNSALAQDLNSVDLQAQSLTSQIGQSYATLGTQIQTSANQLIASGTSAANFSVLWPQQLLALNNTLSQSTTQAIGNFANALNKGSVGGGGQTIQLPAGTTVQQQAA